MAHLGTVKGSSCRRGGGLQGVEKPYMQMQGGMPKEACGHQLLGTHAGTHKFTRMHARQYLSRPSWETQPSWITTLPSPQESKEKQERKPLGRQAGGPPKRSVAADTGGSGRRGRKAGEGKE